jgi:signal transduction histidine kinase
MHTLRLDGLINTDPWRSRDTEVANSPRPTQPSVTGSESADSISPINDSAWMSNAPPCSAVGMAAVAHELRNSIGPLAAAVEIMGSGRASPAMLARTLPLARQQIKHMSRLVNDLLDTARLANGRIELELADKTVQEVIEEAVSACRDSAARHQHKVTLEMPREPLRVRVDPDRMAQVLGNLLGNAIKYTPARGRIAVTVWRDDSWACVRIADNGIGIDPEQLDSIFGMFCQQPHGHDLSEGGLGIGLSLVRSLVELHGGNVKAYSAGKDQGSTFTVRLPLVAHQ